MARTVQLFHAKPEAKQKQLSQQKQRHNPSTRGLKSSLTNKVWDIYNTEVRKNETRGQTWITKYWITIT